MYEDSDEEDGVDNQSSAPKAKLNQSGDIDSTLANFMAVSMVMLCAFTVLLSLYSMQRN